MALPKQHRLSSHRTVSAVARVRPAATNDLGTFRYTMAPGPVRKCAVIVPARVAPKATTRNALRRRITEALRPLLPRTIAGWHGTITVRSAQIPTLAETASLLLDILRKSAILQQ